MLFHCHADGLQFTDADVARLEETLFVSFLKPGAESVSCALTLSVV